MKRIATIFAIAWLAGCASGPIATNDATPIPPERILDAELTKPKPGTGSIILKREHRISLCMLHLLINGKRFAELHSGEKIQIYLAPGRHMVGAQGSAMCFDSHAEIEVDVVAGETKTYRAAPGDYGVISLHPTSF